MASFEAFQALVKASPNHLPRPSRIRVLFEVLETVIELSLLFLG